MQDIASLSAATACGRGGAGFAVKAAHRSVLLFQDLGIDHCIVQLEVVADLVFGSSSPAPEASSRGFWPGACGVLMKVHLYLALDSADA